MSVGVRAPGSTRLPWQPCECCGALGHDAQPDEPVVVLVCPRCGHEEERRQLPFFSVVVLCTAAMPDDWRDAAPRVLVSDIHMLALVCDDEELLARLDARGRQPDAEAPPDFLEQTRFFNTWLRATLDYMDTSVSDPDETAARVAAWVRVRL